MKSGLLAVAFVLLVAWPVQAQTLVVNPTTVQFTPSADQDALGLDGLPKVARYELRHLTQTGGAIAALVNLGKPAPTGGIIVITTALLPSLFDGLARDVVFVSVVAAIGPSGEAVSDRSNPFGFPGVPAPPGTPVVKK
jgi:hypothetical protein